ncbi:MAG: hypothetical protein KF850_04340 [Labilithrix sp.]|nr:hypothetical protein [Labilithrix sp.]MBX3211239.1 hypothetical protein [Labilithrix sp.]
MWYFVDEPWQYRVLDQLRCGVDLAQLERTRSWTPTQRLEALEELMALADELRAGVTNRKPTP